MKKELHPEASAYFNAEFVQEMNGSREEYARKAIERIPFFADFAGNSGDAQLAGDLLAQGVVDNLVHTLDLLMRARPSFSNDATHTLWALELVQAMEGQLNKAVMMLTVAASEKCATFVCDLPPEQRDAMLKKHGESASAEMQKLFKVLFPEMATREGSTH